jgi:hypothetical protein
MNDITPVLLLLDAMSLRYEQVDVRCVRLGFNGEHISFEVLLIAEKPLLSLVAIAEPRIPAARVDEAIRLANRINAQAMRLGMLWIHPEKRTLGFEVALPTVAGVSPEALDLVLGTIPLNVFWPAFAGSPGRG